MHKMFQCNMVNALLIKLQVMFRRILKDMIYSYLDICCKALPTTSINYLPFWNQLKIKSEQKFDFDINDVNTLTYAV